MSIKLAMFNQVEELSRIAMSHQIEELSAEELDAVSGGYRPFNLTAKQKELQQDPHQMGVNDDGFSS